MSGHYQTHVPLPWKTNVMGILGECRVLLVSILCPPVAYYVTSETFEKPPAGIVESCIGGYCLCCGFLLRTRLRDKYNLDGSLLGDLVAHCCCHCVALARIWREAEVQAEAEQQQMQHHPSMGPNAQLTPMHSHSLPQQMSQSLSPQGHPPQQFMAPGLQQMGYGNPYQQSPLYMAMPQPAVMMRPMGNVLGETTGHAIAADHQNTIDTNLSSDFELKNDTLGLRQDTDSCVRHNSMDPPPSNTDPDPWGMLPGRQSSSGYPAPPVGVNQSPPTAQPSPPVEKRREQVLEASPSQPNPIVPIVEETKPKNAMMSKRLAGLRPPNQAQPNVASEGSTAKQVTDAGAMADQVMLGGMNYVKILSIAPGESDRILQPENSQEDPPQHQPIGSRVGSGASKTADGSFVTGGTAGSVTRRVSLTEFAPEEAPQQ